MEPLRLLMEPRKRTMSSGAVEPHPGAVDGLKASVSDSHYFDKDPDTDQRRKGDCI